MTYLHWLLIASASFALLERLRPQRPAQPVLRRGLFKDFFYLVFNGHYYSVLMGGATLWVADRTRELLAGADLLPAAGLLDDAPLWLAALAYFLASDFLQWCVHVLLHKIPPLWKLHQVHHSVVDMDWAGNFRFHWGELVVYRSLLYVPLLFLGGRLEALFPVWVFATFWGHFNHSNLRAELGPLGYLFNSPRMHMWHHDASVEGGVSKNYGIVLSLWDWLFGTAYWPRDRAPERLGFEGLEELPEDLPRQLVWPLLRKPKRESNTPAQGA